MKREQSIVLVSGGMDSCVAAAIASSEAMAFLHLNYGQKTEERELKAFHEIADFYKVDKRLVVDVDYLKEIGGSALTDEKIEVPIRGETRNEGRGKKDEIHNKQSSIVNRQSEIPSTYVPFRNAHLLSIATSWAEVIGAGQIYIGAVEEDSSGYPDCRELFYDAFQETINIGTKPETSIEIVTPLIQMKKREIVEKGLELKAPFHLTWSCYKRMDTACGECDSCLLRLKGFREAGVEDPIPYKSSNKEVIKG